MLINALNGLVYGSLLFVLASGLVLIYGLRRVVNFSHGALYMLGAYIGYLAAITFSFPLVSSPPASRSAPSACCSTWPCSASSAPAIRWSR